MSEGQIGCDAAHVVKAESLGARAPHQTKYRNWTIPRQDTDGHHCPGRRLYRGHHGQPRQKGRCIRESPGGGWANRGAAEQYHTGGKHDSKRGGEGALTNSRTSTNKGPGAAIPRGSSTTGSPRQAGKGADQGDANNPSLAFAQGDLRHATESRQGKTYGVEADASASAAAALESVNDGSSRRTAAGKRRQYPRNMMKKIQGQL